MSYTLLTAVHFRHHYYASTRYDQLQVHIPVATARDLRRYGLLLRQQADGITLSFDDTILTRENILQDALTLIFDLSLKDHLFYNYTDLQQHDLRNSILLFTNKNNSTGRLHQELYVSASEVAPLTVPCFVRPFGQIELLLTQELQSNYEIHFAPKATHWHYFLMSGHLQEIAKPAVVDPSGTTTFKGPQSAVLPDGRNVITFISDTPVTLAQQQSPFMLVDYATGSDAWRVVIPELPKPDVSRISAAGGDPLLSSEIFLY
ncbi:MULTISPECIES: hypothetical protein [unclassified Chitinophaga]|uniref:hypothetical protein n=1 Tax=unclassified Chitinophaga TaxID=2619133 RepID=UPI0009D15F3A|nr:MULTISPECIES: hypothetical protein [unclassified Chitinophaga]OMP77147.1 hypothetical protein BW716_21455 [[Flexibacter] sp. ATCC 35208]WPV65056.1 hypothetical protein QQL36_24935 [Chitinophaga sp. LS1]